MGDVQSNLANFLNDIGNSNSSTAQDIGDGIGTIADIAGAIGGIGGIVSLVGSFMGQGDQTQAELQTILTTIQNDFQQLNEAQKGEDIVQRLTDIGNQLAPAQAVLDSLQSLAGQLPLTPFEVTQQLQPCVTTINALAPDGNWLASYNDQVYWNDYQYVWPPPPWSEGNSYGYGQQAPNGNPDGTVFNYTYILPAYLNAVFIFLSVGGTIDPDFVQNWANSVIRPAAALLQTNHDQVLNSGLTQLSPGYWTGQILAPWLTFETSIPPALTSPRAGVTPLLNTSIYPYLKVVGVNIEYGAVEKFSGYSSVAVYTLVPPFSLESTDPSPHAKFQIRLLRRAKLVYNGAGLWTAWKAINNLKSIVGDPLLPGPAFGVWSFRRDILPSADVAGPDGSVSLMAVANFIRNTLPADTPTDQLWTSFQALLSV